MMSLNEALAVLPDAVAVGDPATVFRRVHTDTRTLQVGDLFVALRGDRFDAHDFLPQAAQAGAAAGLAERGLREAQLPGLQVKDSLAALQSLATAWRQRWQGPLVAVTGSNGKTTVTQMVASILRAAHGENALATVGNLNNHIGVPLTLLRLRDHHRAAVVELGMNHPGEIRRLAVMAAPNVALVNNAQREHQEFMQSVAAVALENGAALEALASTGIAVFPADDAEVATWRKQADKRTCLSFALDAAADVTVSSAQQDDSGWRAELHTPWGDAALRLAMAGKHNLKNALAAASAALAAGISLDHVVAGLASFQPVKGRSQMSRIVLDGRPVSLVDDSYNANPDSVLAAIDVLAGLPAPQWLILGDMGEVGSDGPAFHAEVGMRSRERGISHLWCAGSLSADTASAYGPRARHFETVDLMLQALAATGAAADRPEASAILVKGSRFMAMERVVQALQSRAAAQGRA